MDRLLEYCAHHPWLAAYVLATGLAALVYEWWQRLQDTGAIAPHEVVRLMNQGATLLDVRPAADYAQGHIGGARHFDGTQIDKAAETLKRYKERPLVVYCDRGTSAAGVVRTLTRQGFTKVFKLRGGLAAWRTENLPLARDSTER